MTYRGFNLLRPRLKARDIYRVSKMTATAIGTAIAYILVECPEMPHYWRVGLGAFLVALGALGLYVSPSPIHASDVPVPVGPDIIEKPAEPGGGAV